MMEVKRILWPTDFSKNAAWALPYVTSLMEKYQTEIYLLYVIEELENLEPWYGELTRSHVEEIRKWQKERAGKRLDEICSRYLNGCPHYIRHITTGDPAQEILRFIEKAKVDMVVMAKRGEKGHFRFGSVSEKVVKNAPVPVVTIPIGSEK